MKIVIVAGEKSGDNYGALLIDAIRKVRKDVYVIGTGGEGIRKKADFFIEGVPSGYMGFFKVFLHLPSFYHAFKKVSKIIEKERPDKIVFIDNPGFNLKLASILGKKYPSFYYIPPKVWAHHYRRIKVIKKYIRAVIVIFPFEKEMYEREGITAFWFGHPVRDLLEEVPYVEEVSRCAVGLLPGSRKEEIRYIFPVLCNIVKILQKERKIDVLVSASDRKIRRFEEKFLKKFCISAEIIEGDVYPVINRSTVVLAGSGTVNLEVALTGKPMIVFYKTNWFDYILAKLMVKLDMISPVNLVAGEKVVPEYIQYFPYKKIVQDITEILEKDNLYKKEKEFFKMLKDMLGTGSVSSAIARFLVMEQVV